MKLATCNVAWINAFYVEVLDVRAECITEQMDDAGNNLQNNPLHLELGSQEPDETFEGSGSVTNWSESMK